MQFKLKQRTVNFQKVEKFAEDRKIRITKLVTLFTQLFLEGTVFYAVMEPLLNFVSSTDAQNWKSGVFNFCDRLATAALQYVSR